MGFISYQFQLAFAQTRRFLLLFATNVISVFEKIHDHAAGSMSYVTPAVRLWPSGCWLPLTSYHHANFRLRHIFLVEEAHLCRQDQQWARGGHAADPSTSTPCVIEFSADTVPRNAQWGCIRCMSRKRMWKESITASCSSKTSLILVAQHCGCTRLRRRLLYNLDP